MSDEAELQRRIAELEHAVNWTKPTLGLGEAFEGGLMASPLAARSFVRLWRAGRAVVEASYIKAPPDTLVELERKPSDPAPDALAALASLVGIIDRTGGYMTPADQEAMRTARALLAGGGRDGRG